MNYTATAKLLIKEMDECRGLQGNKGAVTHLANKLKSLLSAQTVCEEETVMVVHLDCGVPSGVLTNHPGMGGTKVIFLEDPNVIEEELLDRCTMCGDKVVMKVMSPTMSTIGTKLVDIAADW